jgi:hypothetical protein
MGGRGLSLRSAIYKMKLKRFSTFSLLILLIPIFTGAISLPNPLGETDTFEKLVTNITNYIFGVIGALAVLMFVYAGILFVISAGSEEKIGKAKKAAIYAAVGAAIAIAGAGLVATIKQVLQG